ncbi:PaaI family thioesterase [Nocardioides terrisoli]|uniref:PaaI family thioesterase n=1 Tax=Nocardioides terrisoli TaxID=3388267 RepID=UPI00287B68F5|nr:PaaI family thioesterase [Nocardioides marmorisolisilvae]
MTFSRFYVGDRFAHGGAIALFFDDVLGRMASQLGPTGAKTAHLSLGFRRPAAVGVEVAFVARVDRVEGRKRFVSAALRDGGELIAEAMGIWIGERTAAE